MMLFNEASVAFRHLTGLFESIKQVSQPRREANRPGAEILQEY